MKPVNVMNYKTKEEAVTAIMKKHLKLDGNMLLSERLFVAKSIISWIYDNTKNPLVIKTYIDDVERYLDGDLELTWKNGIIVKKKIKKENKNENKNQEE